MELSHVGIFGDSKNRALFGIRVEILCQIVEDEDWLTNSKRRRWIRM